MLERLRAELGPGSWIAAKPQIDPDANPIRYAYAPDPGLVKLRLAVGGGVAGVVLAIFLLFEVTDGMLMLVLGGFGFFGALHVVIALSELGYRREIVFSAHTVRVDARSWLGRSSFEEPLARYSGVLLREEQLADRGVGNTVSTRRYQIVELLHPSPSRTLPLWVEETSEPPRRIQERFAERLGLPALAPDAGAVAARPPVGLDVPLRERAEAARDPGPPPREVTLRHAEGRTFVTVRPSAGGRWLGLAVLLGSLACFVWILYNLVPPEELPLLLGGLLAMIATMVGVAWLCYRACVAIGLLDRSSNREPIQELWIDAHSLGVITRPIRTPPAVARIISRVMPRAPSEDPREEVALLGAIEQIRVDRYTSYRSRHGDDAGHADTLSHTAHVLLVDTDSSQLRFAAGCGERALVWVRDYLKHRVATGGQRRTA